MPRDYGKCIVLIYDDAKNQLAGVEIAEHDDVENRIKVHGLPRLPTETVYELLILTEPTPRAYKGRVHNYDRHTIFSLYRGQDSENRQETRYAIDAAARIESLVFDGTLYPLHTPLEARLVNISTGGMRIRTRFNALFDGNRFQIKIKIKDTDKLLISDVVYRKDTPPDSSEFGCRLVREGI
ncbi:MAG: PilZ domain-containing protein [Oscillospiraceae bacterium]|nr:PilZ domain-containing protein [Oscillospiraceae bacterium]